MTSNTPSIHRAQHAEAVEAPRVDRSTFRQGWRIRSRLDGLRDAGRIDLAIWQAAVEYRDAWARVWAGRGGDPGIRISGGRDVHDRQIGLVGTMGDIAEVERRIGRLATTLCFACVVNDLSWPEIGRRYGRSNHTAEAWTVLALRALAAAWGHAAPGRWGR
jgi:hypothetical protein